MKSSYSENQPYGGKEFAAVLAAMSPSQLRNVLKDACRYEANA